jgi:hypothetical protein
MTEISLGNSAISERNLGDINFSVLIEMLSSECTLTRTNINGYADKLVDFYKEPNKDTSTEVAECFRFILFELLENAAKYSVDMPKKASRIFFSDYNDFFCLKISNISTKKQASRLMDSAQEINKATDWDQLFISKIENQDSLYGQIGLLTLVKEYETKVIISVDPGEKELSNISIETILPKKVLKGDIH